MSGDDEQLRQGFLNRLDSHGYGFHHAVVRKIKEIYPPNEQDGWHVEAVEFPVGVRGHDTRIDILVRANHLSCILVCECKRVNLSLGKWCFAKSEFVRRGRRLERVYLENVKQTYPGEAPRSQPDAIYADGRASQYTVDNAFHLGMEVRDRNEKGEADGGRRNAIEEACTQVLKGMNGLVPMLGIMSRDPRMPMAHSAIETQLLPVIFTTAKLWASTLKLDSADIETGKFPVAEGAMKSVPWLYLQYPTSPGIKHQVNSERRFGTFSEMLDPEFTRSIAIVSASGIADFLEHVPHDVSSLGPA